MGCLAVLAIGGMSGLVALGLFVKKRYPWVLELGRASHAAVARGKDSPAVQELNRTLCAETLLFSGEEVSRFQQIREQKPSEGQASPFRWVLLCHVRVATGAPGCDRVAQVFHQASTERGPFLVVVNAGLVVGSGKPTCTALYDADGKLVRRIPSPVPRPPR
jgi:hypothetical protein